MKVRTVAFVVACGLLIICVAAMASRVVRKAGTSLKVTLIVPEDYYGPISIRTRAGSQTVSMERDTELLVGADGNVYVDDCRFLAKWTSFAVRRVGGTPILVLSDEIDEAWASGERVVNSTRQADVISCCEFDLLRPRKGTR